LKGGDVTSKNTEEMRLRKKIEWLFKVDNMRGVKLLKEKYERKYGK
tara:strand:- start:421 stop:558 length:138 start_codon:yes stop_codon:yes gene_type:complete